MVTTVSARPTRENGWDRREQWLTAATNVTRELLADDGQDPLAIIARVVRSLAGAAFVTVALPTHDGRRVMVEVVDGADECLGALYSMDGSLAGRAIESGKPATHDVGDARPAEWAHADRLMRDVGTVVAIPLIGAEGVRGALVIARPVGGDPFTALDIELATAFASQAAISLELADGRENRHRIQILEDRARLAGDLHDHTIQRLFATALSLEVANEQIDSADVGHVVASIRDTIDELRDTIAGLTDSPPRGRSLTLEGRLNQAVDEAVVLLPHRPRVTIDGALHSLSCSESFCDDMVAVIRETLSNAGRHARATRVEVAVRVRPDLVTIEVTDDGAGLGEPDRNSGLGSLARRAERNQGTFTIGPALPAARVGTCATWTGRPR